MDELLAAIAPDTVIQLEPGTYNLSGATGYGLPSESPYYAWTEKYDGFELMLQNVKNLTIRGSGKVNTTLECDPRSASVINLKNCENVTLEDFTAGHTLELGECSSGVIYLQNCTGTDMNRLGIYGCGMIGLQAADSKDISLADSDVYDCSSSAVQLASCEDVSISGTRIYRIGSEEYGGYTYFDISISQNVTVENCEISDSSLMTLAIVSGSTVQMKGNLFSNNRTQQAAFSLQSACFDTQAIEANLVLDDNRFEGCSIRRWFSDDGTVTDGAGNPLTYDQMNELYSTGATEPTQKQLEIHVSTVDELIAAIGPNVDIVLDAELYDLSTATGYGTSKGDYYYWLDEFDGPQLVIDGVDNLTIRSNDGNVTGHTIAAIPRYANVLTFKACSYITLSGFTAGHTREPGVCAGGVLQFQDSTHVTVDNCGLFGCGILGVDAGYCTDIRVANCDIYECSQGGVRFQSTEGIVMENNTLRDLDGSDMSFYDCKDVTVNGETLIPADASNSIIIQSEEQKGTEALNTFVSGFAFAYFYGDKDTMSQSLSKDYTGGVETYPGDTNNVIVQWFEVTVDMWKEAAANGTCEFAYPYCASLGEETAYLNIVVVRENDEWKVSSYSLDK